MNSRRLLITISIMILMAPAALAKKKITLPSSRAVFHNNQGVSFLNSNDIDRAELEFKTAIELSPEYVEAYNNLGVICKMRGQYDRAAAQFRRAIKLDKSYAAAYSHLGAVLIAKGDIDGAIKTIRKGLKKDGTLADGHYNLGIAYLEKTKQSKSKDYANLAETSLKKATELNPNLTHVHLKLAELYETMGNYERAGIRYRLALGDKPNAVSNWIKQGNLLLKRNEPYKAQNAFLKALEIDPMSAEAHMALGLFYTNEKRYPEAVNEFKGVTTITPADELGWFRLGTVYLTMGDFAKAEAALMKAKEANPSLGDASFNLGLAFLKQGKKIEALGEWKHTVIIDPNNARALYNLGNLLENQGEAKEAMQMYCRFIKAAGPDFPAETAVAKRVIESNDVGCD